MTDRQVASPAARYHVQRWTLMSAGSTIGFAALVAALAFVPRVFSIATTQHMTSLLILVILGVMWNALAGYGGLVSVGQQAFIGVGAYSTIYLTQHGMAPYWAMVLAALIAGAVSVPVSVLLLRLTGGQFAIAAWVVAEVFAILVSLDQSLGGGTGISLAALNTYAPDRRQELTYWLALATAVLLLSAVIVLLRSRLGPSLQAIRDDEQAAASVGINVMRVKRILFVLAALGCGAAGALILANTLFIETQSVFGIQWSAYMIFIVLVGGLGTVEGPIIGAVLFFLIQNRFADYGPWYLVGLGVIAILIALFVPRGIWGEIETRFDVHLLPVGHTLRTLPAEDGTHHAHSLAMTTQPGDHLDSDG